MALPAETTYGVVTGCLVHAVADGTDPDLLPDSVPMVGQVTFTAGLPDLLLPTSTPKTSVTLDPVPVTLDGTGSLAVTLVAGQWTVSFAITGLRKSPFSFMVPAGGTVDLSSVTPAGVLNGVAYFMGPKGDPGIQGIPGAGMTDAALATAVGVGATKTALSATFVPQASAWTDVAVYGAKFDGITDDTAAIQAAFDSGKPLIFPPRTAKVTATVVPKSNAHIKGFRGKTVLAFTAGGTYTAQLKSDGVPTGLKVLFDVALLNVGAVEGLTIDGGNAAASVGIGASLEYAAAPPQPLNHFIDCAVRACTWGVYGSDDPATVKIGSLTGSVFHNLQINCGNGISLGQQSSDDVSFTGATRISISAVSGVAVSKAGGHSPAFENLYIGLYAATQTGVLVANGACSIGHLFIESSAANVGSGIVLAGSATTPATIHVDDYHHNMLNGSKLVRVQGVNDQFTIEQMADRDWLTAKPATTVLSMEYGFDAVVYAAGRIGYTGIDDGTIVAFSYVTPAGNGNLRCTLDLTTKAGRVQFQGYKKVNPLDALAPGGIAPAFWLRADRTQVANGATVATWVDVVNNVVATLAVGAPVMAKNGLGGKAAVSFPTTAYLDAQSRSASGRPVTIMSVCSFVNFTNNPPIGGNVEGGGGGIEFRVSAAAQKMDVLDGSVAMIGSSTTALVAATAYVLAVTLDAAGNFAFYRNGIPDGSGTSATPITAARHRRIGASNSAISTLTGAMAEYLEWDAILTPGQILAVALDLGAKYGVTI